MVYAVYAGSGKMDAVNAADAVRALGMNPTLALIQSLGGTEKPGNHRLNKLLSGGRGKETNGDDIHFIKHQISILICRQKWNKFQ